MAKPEPRPSGGSGTRRNGDPMRKPVQAEPPARSDSKVRRPSPGQDEVAPPRRSGDSKIGRLAGSAGSPVRTASDSKIRRMPASAAADAPAPPSTDSRIRRGMGAPGEAGTKTRPREERPDPLFKLKKAILLSMPVLLILCVVMWVWANRRIEQNEAVTSKGPVKIVQHDYGAEIENANLLFDQAFDHRKAAMTLYRDEPGLRKTEIDKAIEKCTDARKVYLEAKAELEKIGEWGDGYRYIEDNLKQIEDVIPKLVEMLRAPAQEPEKAPGTTVAGDEKKPGEKK